MGENDEEEEAAVVLIQELGVSTLLACELSVEPLAAEACTHNCYMRLH